MTAPPKVLDLIERFQRDAEAYRSRLYNETQVRQEFIDPLFEALGWDVGNRSGAAAAYREVILEYSMKIGDTTKAPDYLFRAGGSNRFFVEAKKPSVNLQGSSASAYQVRRYAWTGGLPLSILTDFQEFVVYDCRVEPNKNDKPNAAQHLYLPYSEYADKWDTIAELFHRDAVLSGSLEKFAQEQKAPKGALPVDKAFLAEIDGWRALLAKNIAIWNPELTQRELNYAVQMTLDRIIFLRICEDRGIEFYGKLQSLLEGGKVYTRLINQFRDADDRYNSGLFHFERERGREEPDTLTLNLHIDDEPLKKIIKSLYYPDSPYEFSMLPVEVLGNVYEQFLGKVITIGANRKVEVEEKPEVRKAGGVYYTPSYIVEYIVKNTVGKLLEGKTPKEAAKLRILDPACGSGSFLIGAYQYLLDWHRDQYITDGPQKHKKELYRGPGEDWRLTTNERKRILLNNIYGVDIDAQAVEVTKLSLSLKMLEGETEQTLGTTRQMFQERALPDLSNNIKCGNSLIGPDFYESEQARLLTDEEQFRVNAFDWQTEFSEILQAGGFDAVIGNPPYVRIQTTEKKEISYYGTHYQAAVGNYDIYCLFAERGVTLLRTGGRMGYIVAHRFFKTDYGQGLRKFIVDNQNLEQIIDFDGYMVFSASINTCIIILAKHKERSFCFGQIRFTRKRRDEVASILENLQMCNQADENIVLGPIPISTLSSEPWIFIWSQEESLWEKLNRTEKRLGHITTHIFQGLKTGSDPIYIGDLVREDEQFLTFRCQFDNNIYEVEKDIVKPLVKGGHMNRYYLEETNKRVLFPYEEGRLINQTRMMRDFPKAWNYLCTHKKYLENREDGKKKGEQWYAYTRSQALNTMHLPRIDTPDYYAHASYCLDIEGKYYFCGGGAGGYGIVLRAEFSPYYVLGLLNSKLLDWYLHKVTVRAYQTAYMYVKKYIEQLPIRTINFSDPADKALHDKMVSLVERMLDLHKRFSAAKMSQEKTILQRQIEATDRQIDRLVYELYGLTQKEVKIVEEATS